MRLLPPYPGLYDCLGVSPEASHEEIKRAFWALSRQHHPDVAGQDNAARYREITEAWSILKDPDRRREYDTITPEPANGSEVNFDDWDDDDTSVPAPSQGADITVEQTISTAEAKAGTVLQIRQSINKHRINVTVKVPAGIKDGTTLRVAGKGAPGQLGGANGDLLVTVRVSAPVRGQDWHVHHVLTELEARMGTIITVSREGGPKRRKENTFYIGYDEHVKIPAGITSGKIVRARGKGHPGEAGGENGDLFVTITVVAPERGEDIYITEEISYAISQIGMTISVPVTRHSVKPDGTPGRHVVKNVRVKIWRGIPDGYVFTFPGEGQPGRYGGHPGALTVRIKVLPPEKGKTEHYVCDLQYDQWRSLRMGSHTNIVIRNPDGSGERWVEVRSAMLYDSPMPTHDVTETFEAAGDPPDPWTLPGDVVITFRTSELPRLEREWQAAHEKQVRGFLTKAFLWALAIAAFIVVQHL